MAEDIHLSDNQWIGKVQPCFIIAEIGQNHQGNITTAKELILAAKKSGADCVKFQKSHLEEKFTEGALTSLYESPHSWGKTYGEHKKHLEFSNQQFEELQDYANSIGIMFTASAMDPVSLDFLHSLKVPFIKIGSGDNNNPLLLKKAAKLNVPLVISTGMLDMEGVTAAYKLVKQYHKNFAILHCVSSYPASPSDIDLNVIETYKQHFSDVHIGYSGHEKSIYISIAAVAKGAKILERHFTLDRRWKGSDHVCSLEPSDFEIMVKAVREVEQCLGPGVKEVCPSEESCLAKLGKSIVAAVDLNRGDKITETNIKIKVSKPHGIPAGSLPLALGLELKTPILADYPIKWSYLK